MTVEINTITRVTRRVNCMSCNWRRHDHPRSIVTDHYLLDHHTGGKPGQWDDGPANNCQFRMILKIILKKKESRAPSIKRQAATANRI